MNEWMKEICYAYFEIRVMVTYLLSFDDSSLKFTTLGNLFKTSHFLKVVILLKTSHFKSCDSYEN